jgi:putative oxidoreductase
MSSSRNASRDASIARRRCNMIACDGTSPRGARRLPPAPIGARGNPDQGRKPMSTFLDHWAPRLLSVLRIVAGFLFIAHGTQKWLDFPIPARAPATLFSLSGAAGALELVGGALLIVGLYTRPTAFVLSGLMAFAYFIAHAPQGFWPLVNRGELAALYSFLFLYIAAAGGGPWSADRWLRGRR